MQVIPYKELKKAKPEYVKELILECVNMSVQMLLVDEVFEKVLSLLAMSDDEEEIERFFVEHWKDLLDRILQESWEKFYQFAFWFFKEYEELSVLNLENNLFLLKLLESVEKEDNPQVEEVFSDDSEIGKTRI